MTSYEGRLTDTEQRLTNRIDNALQVMSQLQNMQAPPCHLKVPNVLILLRVLQAREALGKIRKQIAEFFLSQDAEVAVSG